MNSDFKYGDLTWPEVAALPRHTPLILPLGLGLDRRLISDRLGPGPLGWLPAVPYGWPGSEVAVPSAVFDRAVAGILSAPLEEGFERVTVASPGVRLNLPAAVEQVEYAAAGSAIGPATGFDSSRVVLVPCGHTEQHGLHLPMCTDTLIIEAIGQGTASAIPELAQALPALPYGVSTHRRSFAGTFNMGGRAFEEFLVAVVGELVQAGADRIYLISGHGGNVSFLVNVVKYAGERFPTAFTATANLHTSGRIGVEAIERYRRSAPGGMGHAGELETSLMLHLRPDLCRMDRAVDETDFIATENYYMDWVEGGELIANPPWEDDTRTGAYGAGTLATADNGARWLAAAIAEKVGHVREIHEQQDRRMARRRIRAEPGD